MAQLVATMSGVVLGEVVEVYCRVDLLYPSVYKYPKIAFILV